MHGGFILLDRVESRQGFKKAVVGGIVVDTGDFADHGDSAAGLCVKLVVQAGCHGDALPGFEDDFAAGWEGASYAIAADCYFALGECAIGRGVVQLADKVAAATVNDVFRFVKVKVEWGDLVFTHEHDFFGVSFMVGRVADTSVTQGEQQKSLLEKITVAKAGQVPAKVSGAYFVGFGAFVLPVFDSPQCERGKDELMFIKKCPGVFDIVVDFRSSHGGSIKVCAGKSYGK